MGWREDTAGKAEWRGVGGNILFPLMGEEYLRNRVVGMVGGKDVEVDCTCGGGGTAGH